MPRSLAAAGLLCLAATALCGGERRITLLSHIEQMADLRALVRLPDPPYTARQASSRDPASTSPDDPDGWFANGDAGHFQAVEEGDDGKRYVLLDAKGPGCVTRIWSANPGGVLRVEVDGEVVLEAPMEDLLTGRHPLFPEPFAYRASMGANLYFPIPYRERVRVTSTEGGFYYHVGYRSYPPGTEVEPFDPARLAEIRPAILETGRRLVSPAPPTVPEAKTVALSGRRTRIPAPRGGGLVTELRIRHAPETEGERTLLTILVDGETTVRAPLGAFFGSGPGSPPYSSLPFRVTEDGEHVCRWPMPFAKAVEVRGAEAGSVTFAPFPVDDRTMRFFARWRAEEELATPEDWTLLEVEGKGVYVGTALQVANPVRSWWGEGDEKIYVDGESFPSHFGTGTEDYFGYAWCCPLPFARPYHAQPRCDGPGNYGRTSVNRWHVLDAIPFTRRFRFDLEVLHANGKARVALGAMTCFYALPGARVTVPTAAQGSLAVPRIPPLRMKVIEGAIEGESLRATATRGEVGPQDLAHFGAEKWSRDRHLWWRGGKPGDELRITFDSPRAGPHRVVLYLTRAPDYGTHWIRLGEGDPGRVVNLKGPRVEPAKPFDLGVRDLAKGANTLRVTILEPRVKTPPGNMFGLDCLVLTPR